ncbi:DUF6000 family protein [Prosthecobacter sp.]|uniref:DUF6000 family protein n=1 Tax=Prosthecobacter sp. TaxID=1965333 RepID=UPI0037852EF6
MDAELQRQIELHSAGAAAPHAGIYSDLGVPSTTEPLDEAIISKWVLPFYMWKIREPEVFITNYLPIRAEISVELCRSLLISSNWRPRIAAAYFAAIERFQELEGHIGRLFLRSDVCYSGQGYTLALAVFNTPRSLDFVRKYLDHYLTRKDLGFDQSYAMAALHYMDAQNGTSYFERYLPLWKSFIGNNPNFNLYGTLERFAQEAANILIIRNSVMSAPSIA